MAVPMRASFVVAVFLAPSAKGLLHYQRLHNAPVAIGPKRNTPNDVMFMRLNPTSFSGTDYVITEYPRPSLRRVPNAPVVDFDSDAFRCKTSQMVSIMHEAKGVGLAAPQIGLNERLFVYNPTDKKGNERIVCNPEISKYSEEIVVEEEGCLSLRSDECAGQVARSAWVEVRYDNELGQKVRRRLKGFEARVFQHEYDHLQGILCYDRFPPEDREAVRAGVERLLGLYAESDAMAEPDAEAFDGMRPRPLSARRMPPLEPESKPEEESEREDESGGFGGGGGRGKTGGFGGGRAKTAGGKKREKKKKPPKARDGRRSDNPKFKATGKTAYANRK